MAAPDSDIYNNAVTYHKKWDTKKNKRYKEMALQLIDKASSDCRIPNSWARETYFFFQHIEKKYGIKYSTKARHYFPKLSLFRSPTKFFKEYWRRAYGFIYNIIQGPKVEIGQFKEKFGYVRVYFRASEDIKKEINRQINRLQYSLYRKGAYYKMEKK